MAICMVCNQETEVAALEPGLVFDCAICGAQLRLKHNPDGTWVGTSIADERRIIFPSNLHGEDEK